MKEELESRVPGISKERIESLAVALRMISQLLHVESQKRELKVGLEERNCWIASFTMLLRISKERIERLALEPTEKLNVEVKESQKRELKGDNRV